MKKNIFFVTLILLMASLPSVYPQNVTIVIDGERGDWDKAGLTLNDTTGDAYPRDELKPCNPMPMDDIVKYGYYIDDENLYVMMEPAAMPTAGEKYNYRVNILTKIDNSSFSLYRIVWSYRGFLFEVRDPVTKKTLKEYLPSEAAFAKNKIFEAKIPMALLPNAWKAHSLEFMLWNDATNSSDSAPLKRISLSKLQIYYTIDFTKMKNNTVPVTAEFKSISGEKTYLKLYKTPAAFNPGEIGVIVENLKVRDDQGMELPLFKDKTGPYINNPSEKLIVTYDIALNRLAEDRGKGFYDFFNGNCFIGNIAWTFLYNPEEQAKRYHMKMILPEGWTCVTPWKQSGEYYTCDSTDRFFEATYAAGNLDIRTVNINGTSETIALDERFDTNERDAILTNTTAIFLKIKSIFNAKGPAEHLSVFVKSDKPGQWQHGNESALSHGEVVSNYKTVYGSHEHRIFHTYNAFQPTGIPFESSWFIEGPNMYYDSHIKMMLKYTDPFKEIREIYQQYKEGRAKYDMPLKGYTRFPGEWEKELFLTYNKGTLVSLLLDMEIRESTGGEKSLGDVLRELYAVYGEHKNGPVTDEIIEKTSSAVAGKSLKKFFQKYVNSAAPLVLDRALGDEDGDKLSFAEEKLLGTDPSKADTDGDGISDYDEYLSGSAVIRKY